MNDCPNCLHLGPPSKCKKTNTDSIVYSGPDLFCTEILFNDPLTLALQKIDQKICSGINQNNFVRELIINITALPPNYNIQDICNYILSLPESERTILETDSKWNIVIVDPGV